MSTTVRAAAKINLHLGVGAPREDGFHPLDTVFQAVGLYDDVRATDGDGTVTVEPASYLPASVLDDLASPDSNIVTLAARLLAPCGTPVRLGPLGAGEVAKACNQLVVGATALALGEVTVLAERSGIDLETLFDVLGGGYAGSAFLRARREKFTTGDDSPSGVAKYMVKDLRFAAETAEATGTEGALLPALRAAYDELVDAGLGDLDLAATRRFTAGRSGSREEG